MKNKELIAFDLYGTCIHYPNNVKGFREILSSWILGDTINNLRNILLTRPINIEDAGFAGLVKRLEIIETSLAENQYENLEASLSYVVALQKLLM